MLQILLKFLFSAIHSKIQSFFIQLSILIIFETIFIMKLQKSMLLVVALQKQTLKPIWYFLYILNKKKFCYFNCLRTVTNKVSVKDGIIYSCKIFQKKFISCCNILVNPKQCTLRQITNENFGLQNRKVNWIGDIILDNARPEAKLHKEKSNNENNKYQFIRKWMDSKLLPCSVVNSKKWLIYQSFPREKRLLAFARIITRMSSLVPLE